MRASWAIIVYFAMWAGTASAQTADCKAVEEFFQKLGTVMFVTTNCPTIKPNMIKMKEEATSLGIDLSQLTSYKACPGAVQRGMVSGQTLAVTFADAGGPYPCDSVVTGSDKLKWEQFIQK
ncbi:MAG: hypothetical protein ABSC22_15105 [Roseiarcus sp.]|jgi:hypothetical protein